MSWSFRLQLWIPVLLWAFLIWHLSTIPHLRFITSWWDYPFRKLGHMTVFGILARLFARALTGETYWSWKKIFYSALLVTCLYAASDEIHQRFVEGRHGSPVDVLIDTFGAWVALGFHP
jgi:VanZ family protein